MGGLYRDNGKENGNYYLGFEAWTLLLDRIGTEGFLLGVGVLFGRRIIVFGSLYWVPRIWDWVQVLILTTLLFLRAWTLSQNTLKPKPACLEPESV